MNANTARITLTSFLGYFVMSAMLAQNGIIAPAMATHFDQPLTRVTSLFSWYGTGVLIGSAVAVWLLDRARTGTVVRATGAGIAAALVLLWWTDSWLAFRGWLLLVGALGGIALAAAAFVITRSYNDRWRASMLVVTDLCFSAAGVIISAAVTALLAAGALWSSGYLIVAGVAGATLLIASVSRYPDPPALDDGPQRPLPASIWICGAALFCSTYAQQTLMLWLPSHVAQDLGASAALGGAMIGSFWTGMAIGQAGVFFVVLLVPLPLLLGALLVSGLALAMLLPGLDSPATLGTAVFALGLASSGVLKLVISWASLRMADPPPRLVSTLLLCATGGTALAPALSSWLVAGGSIGTALMSTAVGYALLAAIMGYALLRHRAAPGRAEAGAA